MKIEKNNANENVARCLCGFEMIFDNTKHDISSTEQIPQKPEEGEGFLLPSRQS